MFLNARRLGFPAVDHMAFNPAGDLLVLCFWGPLELRDTETGAVRGPSVPVKHDLPVLPIGLYLRVGLDGVGIDVYEEHFWDLRPVRFEYLYAGLPALDGVEYVEGDNWLGVALSALMRVPEERQVWLGAEALRRISAAPLTEQHRYLLGECVQNYLPLDFANWD